MHLQDWALENDSNCISNLECAKIVPAFCVNAEGKGLKPFCVYCLA